MPLQAEESSLVREALENSLDYPAFREEVRRQVDEGRTSGLSQSEAYVYYTLLNHKRMRRWEKQVRLPEGLITALQELRDPLFLLVLTESWCGDAAPVLPILQAFASHAPALQLRIAMRDEHPQLMDRFLTGQARSIPKLLVVHPGDFRVLASWGPRPGEAMEMAAAYKKEHGALDEAFRQNLQLWYNRDQGRSTIQELAALLALE